MSNFCHLHCHTQYSLLDGAADIDNMMKKAVRDGQKAVAITDHGNMFGAFKFWSSAKKHDIKPIIGCEVYVVENHHRKDFTKVDRDKRYHQLLLAKNATGYKNLCKICSIGFIEGYYRNFPRVNKATIRKYSEGIIATTCCLGSEVQQTILNKGEEAGEKVFLEWLDIFGDDYYIELQRHNIVNIDRTTWSQEKINQILIKWSKKYGVKMIATNDSHYVEHEDWDAHDALLCINSGNFKGIPIAESLKFRETVQYRGQKVKQRFGFKDGGQFYFKNTAEMAALFKDVPESLENTLYIAEQIEPLNLKRDILMPNYVIPDGFQTQDDFLRHLSYEGAKKRYNEIDSVVVERLDRELKIIKDMGFPGYFLIVQDFIQAAREIGVSVGPGRGCLTGDAKVVLKNGQTTDLQNIKIGQEVWTQDGSSQKIVNKFEYEVTEDLLTIKTYYGEYAGITLTKDHKVLVERKVDTITEMVWLPAEKITLEDWLFIPEPKVEKSIAANFFTPENPIRSPRINSWATDDVDSSVAIDFESKVELIADFVLKASTEKVALFLKDYQTKYGIAKKEQTKFVISSRKVTDQVRFLYWRIGLPSSLTVNEKEGFNISIPKTNAYYRKIEGGLLVKVRSIEVKKDVQKVYDIEVENHHNYLTSSFLVHNSAAGSAVAYCTGITNIDPIHYNLLFERFLNPERVSMPDIDIDFDDEGRQRVIDYVVDKYGKSQVAQIITYGRMAARSSIKDVARVLELPLAEANRLAKMVPEGPKVTLKKAFKAVPELKEHRQNEESEIGKTLKLAETLEGSVRQRGIHAAGVIIAPDDITEYIPVCTAKDAELFVTQFDGRVVEDAGMLKMDFLGLKTLTVIKDAIENIHHRFSIEDIPKVLIGKDGKRIDPDLIPLDDKKTYKLFQRGETVGIFQFESAGMQKYLKELKPTTIEDMIAMNALYRPGPLDYIPSFIDRKHGKEKVEHPHKWLEPILKNTYGIMVYQEQIMQTAQIMADYSLGQADLLRRAMGKKKLEEMKRQRVIFREGAGKKGVAAEKADEIFDIMEKFAAYGFNRSHSAAYSVVAFQTAYLKANYPAEYMAAVLTHNMNDIKKLNFFLSECQRMGVKTMLPDVNESNLKFTVNKKGEIRFALAAIKGVGEGAVEALIKERTEKGGFKDLFDLVKRANLSALNRRCLENLAKAGALDSFKNMHRAQYFYPENVENQPNLIEQAVKFGNDFQKGQASAASSLFGMAGLSAMATPPRVTDCEEWSTTKRLQEEREMIGIYLSGHPLDDYKVEVNNFCSTTLDKLDNMKGKDVTIGCIVMSAERKKGKNGREYGRFLIEDFTDSFEIMLFGEDYIKNHAHFEEGRTLFIKGRYAKRSWGQQERYEFKIKEVKLLSSILEESAKKITLSVDLPYINDGLIAKLDDLCKRYAGNMPLHVDIIDRKNKCKLTMRSKTFKLRGAKEAFEFLDGLDGVEYALN